MAAAGFVLYVLIISLQTLAIILGTVDRGCPQKITGNDITRVKMTPRNQIKLQNNERKLKEIPVSDKGTSALGQCVKHGY